ncbi:unnamed protein product [Ectocarpus sp. 6 AP-2014]
MLVRNPEISRLDMKHSLVKKVPIPIAYVVVTGNLQKGTELLTCYGDAYGERQGYTPCKMSRRDERELVDRAYEFVDALSR